MKNFSKYLDSVVEKALNEALESKADKIVSEIQKKMETTEKLHGKQSKLDVIPIQIPLVKNDVQ